MFQIYFLSVLLNILVGLFLIYENKIENSNLIIQKPLLIMILGFASIIVGIIKLFVVAQPDIAIIGDLLPAVFGIVGGFCILLNYFLLYGKNEIILKPVVQKIFVDWKKSIGVLTLVVGILHFIIPQVRVF